MRRPRRLRPSGVREDAMDDIIRLDDQFYILATSAMADDRTRVLKHAETFAVFDRYGDVQPVGQGAQGLYHQGTRFLSRLELLVNNGRPMLLSSNVKEDNALLAVDLTNPDASEQGTVVIPRGTLGIFRSIFLWQGACFQRLRFSNYGLVPIQVTVSFRFDADFADIFEVRGFRRQRRGKRLETLVDIDSIALAYEGLDGLVRRTRVTCSPLPQRLSSHEARFQATLQPQEETMLAMTIACEVGDARPSCLPYDTAFADAGQELQSVRAEDGDIYTSNEQFNDWVNRSLPDLHMMITETSEGPYPFAGIPWFSTPFGRDGIITALEFLWVNPALAKGVLAYLASTQAKESIPEQEAEPGKILHETRKGEMVALGEIPFGRYYGSVDATPLFVVLAGAYYERTADLPLIKAIWPNIELALTWMNTFGDPDGDGFVEYARRSTTGLVHQGWKDSHDAVFHADGTLAEGPIALCEVQGYVYGAKSRAAELAEVLGLPERAQDLRCQAQALKERFEQAFWCEDLSMYGLALDGRKRICRVRASNAGQCLLTGIADQDRARRTAEMLMGGDFFSGWGIRTVAAGEARYNPMSYHNGSVWPHDNALIAAGLARYGYLEFVHKILAGLFDASIFMDLHRLPELFCGFVRRPGQSPTLYPVACAPQAWSAASVFLLLQACLGLSIRATEGRIVFSYPLLPEFLPEIRLRNLRVGTASVDLSLKRYEQDVGITVMRREGRVQIVTIK